MSDAANRLAWATDECLRMRLRLTPARQRILSFLAAQRIPVSLTVITDSEHRANGCDATTVYRTLMLFKDVHLVRQVGLPDKASFFVLNLPGENSHFLVCRSCGAITELPAGDHCTEMAERVVADHRYTDLYHELQFVGLCPSCQQRPPAVLCTKLPRDPRTPGPRPSGTTSTPPVH